jgi:hypothetical protein
MFCHTARGNGENDRRTRRFFTLFSSLFITFRFCSEQSTDRLGLELLLHNRHIGICESMFCLYLALHLALHLPVDLLRKKLLGVELLLDTQTKAA